HPLFKGRKHIERCGPGTAVAVSQPGYCEESEHGYRFCRSTHRLGDGFVVLDHVFCWKNGIHPPGIHEQLAAMSRKSTNVARSAADETHLGISVCHIAVPVESAPVPVGIVEHKVTEKPKSSWLRNVDHLAPSGIQRIAKSFAAARPSWKDQLMSSWIA